MDEFGIIARYFAPLSGNGAFSLSDDAALLPQRPGHDLIVTTDAIAEGVDFFAFDPAFTIAQKVLRVNLSDLAAKGATPACYLLSLSLPHTITPEWLEDFAKGLAHDQQEFSVTLLGGDTAATDGALAISITAFGHVPQGRMVRRSAARAGDHVYVTGTIGDSGGGLAIFKREKHALNDDQRDHLTGRYRVPDPPVAFGAARLRDLAHAAIDVSDGLIADLGHVAKASGVRIEIDGDAVPLSAPLRALWGDATLARAVTAGDDYQIAFTGPPGLEGPFTRIGTVVAGEGIALMANGAAVALPKPGYRHF